MQSPRNSIYEVFLIGDTGDIARHKIDPVLETLKAHLDVNQESAIVFLGDNIYPRGLPEKNHELRKDAEDTLNKYAKVLSNYHGKVLFISGNHDWNKGRDNGYDYVIRQEKYLEKLFGKKILFPSRGCPGPTEIKINDYLTLVLINTQWWLQSGFRPIGESCGCRVSSEEEFFEHLDWILHNNIQANKRVIVAGHAPVYSYAQHGGRYKLRHHLFPFTLYHKRAYVPLPVLGSFLPLYRKYFGAKEDIAHPRYRHLRSRLKAIFKKYPNLIYASGHEHNLQYIAKDQNHFIVSGAGSKLKYVLSSGKNLRFGLKAKGFFKIRFEDNGQAYVSVWVIDPHYAKGKMVFEQQLF
ncbi:MAG TPA: metallophosphoesterase [Daejeonella sp.]|nr:metallophosphoesterase [Daejeonella sp.]